MNLNDPIAPVFIFRGDQLLLGADGRLADESVCVALGRSRRCSRAGARWAIGPRVAWVPEGVEGPPGCAFKPLRSLYADGPAERASLAAAALQVSQSAEHLPRFEPFA